jgi:bifunctional ADP-heptose synthase (sugar kinase/adenylyltransferase)
VERAEVLAALECVEASGGRVIFLPLVEGISTSELVRRLRAAARLTRRLG